MDRISINLIVRLNRGKNERRMRCSKNLDFHFVLCQCLHHVQQSRNDSTLPLRVQMRLDLVKKKDNLPCRLDVKQFSGALVLLPSPNQEVRKSDDSPHPR